MTEWINVREELPPCTVNVLVLVNNRVSILRMHGGKWHYFNHKSYSNLGKGELVTEDPTHWMPLPTPTDNK